MSSNFGKGCFGLETLEYPNPDTCEPVFKNYSFQERDFLNIQRQQLESLKKFYEENPEAILINVLGRSHFDENNNIVLERQYEGR